MGIRAGIWLWVMMCCLLGFGPMAQAAPPLSLYGQLPGIEQAALSESGNRIAFIGTMESKRVLLVTEGTEKLLARYEVGGAKIRSLDWAGDDIILLRTSETVSLGVGFVQDKVELSAMRVIPIGKNAKPWTIFENNRMIQGGIRGYFGQSVKNGRRYGYFGGITMTVEGKSDPYLGNTNAVLYAVDLETGKTEKVAPRADQEVDRGWIVAPDGTIGATLDFWNKTGRWVIRNGKGDIIGEGVSPRGGIGLLGLGPSGNTIIYEVMNEQTDAHGWFELPLTGGAATPFLPDLDNAFTTSDRDHHQISGYVTEDDTPSYHFFDPHQNKVMAATAKAFPGLSVHLLDWNKTFDRLLVQTDGPGDPQTWWLVDIKTGKADVVGTSYPMSPDDVGPMKMIRYKAADGTEIPAVLTLPPQRAAHDLPVIVLPHGGPKARDYPVFDWWAQAFASRGYAVLQPNFRGSDGYGPAYIRAGYGEWGRKMQTDVSDGLAFLATQGIIDPKRACIVGASYGGYAALAGVTLQRGIYRCAVSVAGVADLPKMTATDYRNSGDDRSVALNLKEEIGSGKDLSLVSPRRFAANADAPILLIHGKNDTVVAYDQSRDMASALQNAGKPYEFLTLEGEDHWLSRGETRLKMLEAAVTFVEKQNPPDPQPVQTATR